MAETGYQDQHAFRISGFASETEAKAYIRRAWAGLQWLLLQSSLSSQAELEPQNVVYVENPTEAAANVSKTLGGAQIADAIDAGIVGARPAIYLTGKRVMATYAGSVQVVIGNYTTHVLKVFSEGTSFPRSDEISENSKLRIALELYAAYFAENSLNAKFLTLIMSLEALAPGVAPPQRVLGLLKEWLRMLDAAATSDHGDHDIQSALESLRSVLNSQREGSIGRRIRSIVKTTLHHNGDSDAEEMAGKASHLYRLRSELIHNGWLEPKELGDATSDARKLVERVLRAQFLFKVAGDEHG